MQAGSVSGWGTPRSAPSVASAQVVPQYLLKHDPYRLPVSGRRCFAEKTALEGASVVREDAAARRLTAHKRRPLPSAGPPQPRLVYDGGLTPAAPSTPQIRLSSGRRIFVSNDVSPFKAAAPPVSARRRLSTGGFPSHLATDFTLREDLLPAPRKSRASPRGLSLPPTAPRAAAGAAAPGAQATCPFGTQNSVSRPPLAGKRQTSRPPQDPRLMTGGGEGTPVERFVPQRHFGWRPGDHGNLLSWE